MYDSKVVAPTSEWALAGGSTSNDARDSDVDLTVDLGFHTEQEVCFYLRLTDTDRDGVPLIQRLTGTTLGTNLVFGGSIANIDRAQFAYDTRTQRLDVQCIFNQWGGKKVAGFYGMLINNLSASNSMSTNVLAAPATYTQWQFDHDGTLLDYALASPFRLEATDALLTRPVPSRPDLVYRLEGRTDMQLWTPPAITPSTSFNADNTETTRFAKLDLAPLYAGSETGFIRLKVEIDADLNGTAELVTHSRVQAWSLRTFATAPQTFSMPLLRSAIFGGQTSAAQNLTLNASTAYFAEIIGEGTRFEIDSRTGSLTWKTSAPAADDLIIIRPHWTLATLFPPAAFRSAINPANADRIMFFDGKGYRVFWLKASALGAHWALQTDTTLADAGSHPVKVCSSIAAAPRSHFPSAVKCVPGTSSAHSAPDHSSSAPVIHSIKAPPPCP